MVSFYLTLCQLFSLPCTAIFLFSTVSSPKGLLEAFWHGKVKGIVCSCREDAERGKERVISYLRDWRVADLRTGALCHRVAQIFKDKAQQLVKTS